MTPVPHMFVLHLQPEPSEHCPVRRLRAGLKYLLRSCGLRCVHAHDALGRPVLRTAHGSGDPVAQVRDLVELLDALADTLQARSLPPDAADAITVALASLTVQVERLERQVGEVLNALPE